MTELQKILNKTELSTITIPSNINYGTAIFERGAVELIVNKDTEAEAWSGGLDGGVKEGGGSRRKVKLWMKDNGLKWHCR